MNELSGQTLGKYKIDARLGTGGMATVFKALQPNLDRYVALKIMHGHLAESREFVDRFKREAAAVARLRHPHIVQLHDFDVENGQHYMVMEFIDGPTLKEELETRTRQATPFSLTEAVQIMAALAAAVSYAHLRGIVHRDIKPANIMFTSDGHVVLTDFGIVRMIGATYNTATGFLAGTPAYMSPEQGQGKHGDLRSDIYALGVILYEMLTGRPPFNADTPLALIKQHIETPPPGITEISAALPLAVEQILHRALAKDPAERFQHADEMAQALCRAAALPEELLLKPPPVLPLAARTNSTQAAPPVTPILARAGIDVNSSPYRGLFAFREPDAPYFFGREAFTEQLLTAVSQQPLVAVLGPSGSGKSSVVHAGLLPRLRARPEWLIAAMRPHSHPFQSLAAALIPWLAPDSQYTGRLLETSQLAAAMRSGDTHLHQAVHQILHQSAGDQKRFLLIIDQFEEVYTLCADADVRQRFLDELLEIVDIQRFAGHPAFTLVLTLRTDFLSQALAHRGFADALQNMDVKLGPMNRRELGRAIANPAQRQGLAFETGLVARILDDVGNEPGNLPLLEFALTSLWEKRNGRRLTHDAYEAIGQVEGALARHAEAVFARLSDAEKEQARRVFIQMVAPGAGTEDTRRLATRAELGEISWQLVQKLAKAEARLVVTGRDAAGQETVEVVHEALIRGWQRLRDWMAQDRTFRAWQERLRAALMQWQLAQQDSGALLRGLPLTEAEGWLNERRSHLGAAELAFIEASVAAREAEEAARKQAEEEQRRVLEQEKLERQRAEEAARRAEENARYARRLFRLAIALVIVLVFAVIAAVQAVSSSRRAGQLAATAVANEQVAIDARATAEASAGEAETAFAAAAADAAARAAAESQFIQQRDAAEASAREADAARATAEASARELATAVFIAQTNAQQAEENANIAGTQSRLSTARELASVAIDQINSDAQLALLLALEAVQLPLNAGDRVPAAAEDALFRAMQASQLQRTLSGHTDWIVDVAVSPDGARIATASHDTSVKIWDVLTGQELFTLTDHGQAVNTVAFSPDGSRIATAGDDGFIIIWNGETGARIGTMNGENGRVFGLAFNQDGTQLAAANEDNTVRVWDVAQRRSAFRLTGHAASLTGVAYSPDGRRFATVGRDGRVIVRDAGNGASLYSIEPEIGSDTQPVALNALAFSPDGRRLVTAGNNGKARVWDFETAELLFTLSGHASALFDVAFSDNGRLLATTSGDGTAKVWDAGSGQALYTLYGHSGGVNAIAFTPNSQAVVTGSQDNTARVWSSTPGLTPRILASHTAPVFRLAFSTDGQFVATAGGDRTVHLWDTATGSVLRSFADHNDAVTALDFHPDGSLLVTASRDRNARLWTTATGELLLPLLQHPPNAPVTAVVFSQDGDFIVTAAEDGLIRVWDTETHERLRQFEHGAVVNSLRFSPDGTMLASAGAGGRVIIWNFADGAQLMAWTAHDGPVNDASFSPDSTMVATAGGDSTAKVWDLATQEMLNTFSGHAGPVLGVDFNADGTRLATASADRTAKLWDTTSGQTVRTLLGHTSTVHTVRFSPDGGWLGTASSDRTARINALNSVEMLVQLGAMQLTRRLTPEECSQYLRGLPCQTIQP